MIPKKITNAQILEHMYALFEEFDSKWDIRFGKLEKRADSMEKRMDKRFEQVDKRFDKIDVAFQRLYTNRAKDLERLDQLEEVVGISS